MAASVLTSVAASARKAGLAKTARSLAAPTTVQGRVFALKENVCATVTLEVTIVQSRGALQTAQVEGCVSMVSACVKSPSLGRTAWLEGV